MKAFVCEVDGAGLRRLLPEETPYRDVPAPKSGRRQRPDRTVVWALLAEDDAEALRREVAAGRSEAACGLLLNRAVELLPLAAAAPTASGSRPAND